MPSAANASTKLSQLVESYEFVTQTGRHTKAAANESSATVMRTGTELAAAHAAARHA